ncbi:MAG: PilZ domain-containing protein [Methylobacterium frigidaeris]
MTTIPRPVRIQALLTSRAKLERDAPAPVLCFLHDLSDEGAGLSFPEGVTVPDRFELFLEQGGQPHPVETRWKDGARAGVRFLSPLPDETLHRLLPHLGLTARDGSGRDAPPGF